MSFQTQWALPALISNEKKFGMPVLARRQCGQFFGLLSVLLLAFPTVQDVRPID
jgi:hypothetical protein